MLKKLYENIYLNEIPLPKSPLKGLNSYIITSEDRNLIIDTGFSHPEVEASFMKGIKELGLDLNKTDLLVTHLHSDHTGLAAKLHKEGMKVYAGSIDGKLINEMTTNQYWERFNDYKVMFDLEKDNVSFDNHPGYLYCPKDPINFEYLEENDTLKIGNYTFEILNIPGHTPGHIALYEKEHKLFFCGDHILGKITPNITFWGFDEEILSVYFESLKKVYDYKIDYLFTAHREIIRDHKKRIDELLEHHQMRLEEILNIIKDHKTSVRDTAAKMHWELRCNGWDEFPSPQKWFATGEAMAHLEHLVAIKKATKTVENEVLYYQGL
ncbi:MBL fold metallo-hydrolase [Serpentinicella sp. ANB-PHB4]|uniref:MBL fold metallo-hydrolase n=1 Tax=Serpentinicella sp. ANB-PHB4 TaxID=3074076 RepID=UPI00285960ED|nr:MBL fold metallo-hydrolase [Serpentinicella sp. ANB-PHB4]MDR5658688.1 MBL fold metallo-hydrolase [Serpentinicella sp. ANB-PHB4]